MAQSKSVKPRTKSAEKPSLAARLKGAAATTQGRPSVFDVWGKRYPQQHEELNAAIDEFLAGAYDGEGCGTIAGLWRAVQQAFIDDGIELPTRCVSSFKYYIERREQQKNKTRRSPQNQAR